MGEGGRESLVPAVSGPQISSVYILTLHQAMAQDPLEKLDHYPREAQMEMMTSKVTLKYNKCKYSNASV